MNRKTYIIAMAALLMVGTSAEAQSIDNKLEKLAKDPKTAENAARADVFILGHKISPDSLHQNKEQATKAKKKNRKCKKHTS